MIAPLLWCLLAVPRLPGAVVIATPRGQTSVPITLERGGAAVAVPLLAQPLGLTVACGASGVAVTVGGAAFVFQLGAPFVRAGGTVYGLAGEPYTARDTVFLPLSWLADCVPRALGPRYRWDAGAARLEELPVAGPVAAGPPPVRPTAATAPNPISSLRFRHTVVIHPGHGGADPRNPGRYFPNGLVQKDITLAIARLLRAELVRRGIAASLTPSTGPLADTPGRGRFWLAA